MKPRTRSRYAVVLAVCALFCSVGIAGSSDVESQPMTLTTERIALFKNGLGFFTSGATLPPDARSVRIGQLPIPLLGTFWVGYPEDVLVRNLITGLEESEEKVAVQSLHQLLQLNPGARVTLHTGPGGDDVLEGTLLEHALDTSTGKAPNPYFMGAPRPRDPSSPFLSGVPTGNLLMLKTKAGTVALHAGSIVRADFGDDDIQSTTTITQKRPSIRIELDRPAGGKLINVTYLARGVTWSPSYLIDLSDEETAQFHARALIVNELMDFSNVTLELVTGFPNIKFSEVSSPLALSQTLADFLNALGGGVMRRPSSSITQQAMLGNVAFFDEFDASLAPQYSTAAEGQVFEDLFLYPVERFTLKKGETAWLPLFSASMPYKHIYTWKIGDFLDANDRYRVDDERPDGKKTETVWHSCRLVNSLEMPLTTAPAEFMTRGTFTGQDVCYYTPPGAETDILINRALNVVAEQVEVEVERTRNAEKFRGYQYDLVVVRGELKLRSRLADPVHVEVSKELSGKVLSTSPEAEDLQTAKGLKQANPKHVLTWDIELKPGESRTLTYTFSVYTRG